MKTAPVKDPIIQLSWKTPCSFEKPDIRPDRLRCYRPVSYEVQSLWKQSKKALNRRQYRGAIAPTEARFCSPAICWFARIREMSVSPSNRFSGYVWWSIGGLRAANLFLRCPAGTVYHPFLIMNGYSPPDIAVIFIIPDSSFTTGFPVYTSSLLSGFSACRIWAHAVSYLSEHDVKP